MAEGPAINQDEHENAGGGGGGGDGDGVRNDDDDEEEEAISDPWCAESLLLDLLFGPPPQEGEGGCSFEDWFDRLVGGEGGGDGGNLPAEDGGGGGAGDQAQQQQDQLEGNGEEVREE